MCSLPPARRAGRPAPTARSAPREVTPTQTSSPVPPRLRWLASAGLDARSVAAAATPKKKPSPCSLVVTVTPGNSTATTLQAKSGMTLTPTQGGNFYGAAAKYGCVSGCLAVLIHVELLGTKPGQNGTPVSGASVTTSVSAPSGVATYPSNQPNYGYLCSGERCSGPGNHGLAGLTTNASGNVRVDYWFPGIVRPFSPNISDSQIPASKTNVAVTTISVVAKADHVCSSSGCSFAHREGRADEFVSLLQNQVFYDEVPLTASQVDGLVPWAEPGISWQQAQESPRPGRTRRRPTRPRSS